MDDPIRSRLEHGLQARQAAIAEAWYAAIARTSFSPYSAAELRECLAELTGKAIELLFTPSGDPEGAGQIGAALAGLHYTQPEALGRTQSVLARELLRGLPAEQAVALQSNLAALLEGVATGFVSERTRIELSEQESIRSALVSELREAQRKLRESRDDLEEQVAERTSELREAEQRWRTLVSSSPDPVFTLDGEGRIEFVNYLRPESGYMSAQDLVGRSVIDMVIPEHRELAEAAIRHVFSTGTPAVYEAALRRPGGAIVWYAAHIGPLRRDGRVVAAMVVARDITERKRMEEIKDNLLRDVSHELRTPLARAHLSLDLLLERLRADQIDREGAEGYGRMAFDNIRKLAETVEAILDLSRLEASARALAKERIELTRLIHAAVLDMEPVASEKGLGLVVSVAEDLPQVQGDGEKLSRALRNLIDNAIKFSSAGQIVVSAQRKQDETEVSVSDAGCGILPENLERVFDRFFRESSTRGGVGIGLSICKTIVEAHDGRIWAESDGTGRGATVRFTLPAAPEPAQQQTDLD